MLSWYFHFLDWKSKVNVISLFVMKNGKWLTPTNNAMLLFSGSPHAPVNFNPYGSCGPAINFFYFWKTL